MRDNDVRVVHAERFSDALVDPVTNPRIAHVLIHVVRHARDGCTAASRDMLINRAENRQDPGLVLKSFLDNITSGDVDDFLVRDSQLTANLIENWFRECAPRLILRSLHDDLGHLIGRSVVNQVVKRLTVVRKAHVGLRNGELLIALGKASPKRGNPLVLEALRVLVFLRASVNENELALHVKSPDLIATRTTSIPFRLSKVQMEGMS